jgi:Glycine/D-amino acid oxidases (deaminating)
MASSASIVVCGAGIAGVAVAHELAVVHGWRDVLLVEAGDPLALTSDKSTECYRNWWPDRAMVALMNRSIDRLETIAVRSANRIRLNRRGYLYATADLERAEQWRLQALQAVADGVGPLRIHDRGTELEFVIMVIAVSCVKLLSAHNSTQHTSRKHKV